MSKFNEDEKQKIRNDIAVVMKDAVSTAEFYRFWDVAFRITAALIGVAITGLSAAAAISAVEAAKVLSVVSALLAALSAAIVSIGNADFAFAGRQRMHEKRYVDAKALEWDVTFLDPEKEDFLRRCREVIAWDYSMMTPKKVES